MTRVEPDDEFTGFWFGTPEGSPVPWGLTYDGMTDALRRVDPDCVIHRRRYHAVFPFGSIEGNIGVEFGGWMSISRTTIDTAARFAGWLRREIVPAGAGIAFHINEAILQDDPPGLLPHTDEVTEIRTAITRFAEAID